MHGRTPTPTPKFPRPVRCSTCSTWGMPHDPVRAGHGPAPGTHAVQARLLLGSLRGHVREEPGVRVSPVRAIPARVRALVEGRADGKCEGCGRTAPLELHHRRFRSRGGKHTVSNLVALCGWGNHTGCHGRAHSADPPAGWAISQYEKRTDEQVPFEANGVLVRLTTDGRRVGPAVF
ncbi:HNH endonuclease [Microbacterium sp. ZXX196]|uniref:HNH endonuclease n=1 Tax=Microbacterium sp. ZXX196 TaxID=2609291 RepID=UPI0027B8E2EA|nr:HNH endonuclease [Microbacterium sp. ZXX196]